MEDQFYDANYEAIKRAERERFQEASERLERKYADQIVGENFLGGLVSRSDPVIRSLARDRVLRDLEKLSRGF